MSKGNVTKARLQTDAARCVKCALCLPHCPTYRLKGEEGDSPRGRIELIQSLAEGAIAPGPGVVEHLDGCLTCRACEAVCPAGVPYGSLIDGARARLGARKPPRPSLRLLRFMARRPSLLAAALRALRPFSSLAPARLRPYLRSVQRLPRLTLGPAEGEPVALFLGCVARAFDTETLAATAKLLAAAGYRIEAPRGQTCCGALAEHGGKRQSALALAQRNARAFADTGKVVASASGCTAQLAEYEHLLADHGAFSDKVCDVSELIADAIASGRLHLRAEKPLRVAVHTPCTQRNILRSNACERTLSAIENIKVIPLPPNCCGAAGSYFLDRPQDADSLREPTLEAIRAARPDAVVTANVGCRLHLAIGMGEEKTPAVQHLAAFLASPLVKISA
jgi:glycolate oxidase iron-sulfur subunit